MNSWLRLKWWVVHYGNAFNRLGGYHGPYPETCPHRDRIFYALETLRPSQVKVIIIGQDPYPDPALTTGLAFSIPSHVQTFPPTLINIFKEYMSDLHYPAPANGDLTPWARQGVLLWNAIPSCLAFKSLSHTWIEWHELTKEIMQELDKQHVVFVALGGVARSFVQYLSEDSEVIEASHPSPRGAYSGRNPFMGSRIFSRVNDCLSSQGVTPIDWRLK